MTVTINPEHIQRYLQPSVEILFLPCSLQLY